MSYYQENLQILKRSADTVYQKMGEESLVDVEIIETKQGIQIKRNGSTCYLHSIFDKNHEQESIFKDLLPETRQVIVFGLGLGESIKYLQENHSHLYRIVVIEPSLDIYKKFLNEFSLKSDLKYGNLTMLVNETPDVFADILALLFSRVKETQIFTSLSYRTVFEDIYLNMTELLVRAIRTITGNVNVAHYVSHLWAYNSLVNLMEPATPVENYFEDFKGKSIVIVGAGPSLNKQLEWIQKAKNKAIIVAVGSGIRVLDKNGIIPHFRMAYDGTVHEMKVVEGIDTTTAPLIFSNRLYFKMLQEYQGPKIRMIIDMDTISEYLFDGMNIEYEPIRTGPSITVVATDLFCKAGAKELILLGQDLCFAADGTTYANGGRSAEVPINKAKKDYVLVKNIDGEDVHSISGYLTIRDQLEITIKHFSNIPVFNGTTGGLYIPGTQTIDLNQWLNDAPPLDFEIGDKVHVNPMEHELFIRSYHNELNTMKEELEKISLISARKTQFLKRFSKLRERGMKHHKLDGLLNECDKLEQEFMELPLYKIEMYKNLKFIFDAINYQYYYEGHDLEAYYDSQEKIQLGCLAQLEDYVLHIKNVLWEIENGVKPNVEEVFEGE